MGSSNSQTLVTLWSGRSVGPDPRAHAWYEKGEHLLRLCDGVKWAGAPADEGLGYCVPCRACALTYAEDQVRGRAVFRYCAGFPDDYPCGSYTAPPPAGNIEHASRKDVILDQPGASPMPKITMTSFAYFCSATPNGRWRIVREQREVAEHPEWIRSRDFYGPFREAVKRTHVANQDLDVFRDALPALMQQRLKENQRARFRALGKAYLDLWGGCDAFPGPAC